MTSHKIGGVPIDNLAMMLRAMHLTLKASQVVIIARAKLESNTLRRSVSGHKARLPLSNCFKLFHDNLFKST